MEYPKFKQIVTGDYSYSYGGHVAELYGHKDISHAIYGLAEDGTVWKYIPKSKKWIRIEETLIP